VAKVLKHLIPRIDLSTLEGELSWILTRRQYRIRPCFAMTINKSKGQSLEDVGIDLQTSPFSHGQWYVYVTQFALLVPARLRHLRL
jgi:ATP-dependent DNA helicase PIF1